MLSVAPLKYNKNSRLIGRINVVSPFRCIIAISFTAVIIEYRFIASLVRAAYVDYVISEFSLKTHLFSAEGVFIMSPTNESSSRV